MTIIRYRTRHEDIAIGNPPGTMVTLNRSYTPTLEDARAWDGDRAGGRYVIALLGMSLTDDGGNIDPATGDWDTVDRVEEAFEAMLRLERLYGATIAREQSGV